MTGHCESFGEKNIPKNWPSKLGCSSTTNTSYQRVEIIIIFEVSTVLLYMCSLKVLLFCLLSFQFVVSDSGDYTIHAMDPDVLVEWDLIEQVVSVLPVVFKTFPSDAVNNEKTGSLRTYLLLWVLEWVCHVSQAVMTVSWLVSPVSQSDTIGQSFSQFVSCIYWSVMSVCQASAVSRQSTLGSLCLSKCFTVSANLQPWSAIMPNLFIPPSSRYVWITLNKEEGATVFNINVEARITV